MGRWSRLVWIAGGGLGMAIGAIALFFLWASSGRLNPRQYAQIESYGFPLADGAPETFTVVTYNLGYLSGLGNAATTSEVPVALTPQFFDQNQATAIAALADLEPDIIALQEIDLDARRSYRVNQPEAIAQGLELPVGAIAVNWDKRYIPFPYWPPTAQFGPTLAAQVILSRFPIRAHSRYMLSPVENQPVYYRAFYLDRVAQVAEIAVGDQAVVVINVHLEAFDEPTRRRQTEAVLTLAETYAQDYPVVLVGDFNSAVNRPEEGTPPTIEILLASDMFAPATDPDQFVDPAQFTYPTDQPAYRLDYGFYTPDTLELIDAQVVTAAAQASDHLPVALELRLR
jgi:endonuclease/exonuclease/phosphatase family metal-dependent hydrolase